MIVSLFVPGMVPTWWGVAAMVIVIVVLYVLSMKSRAKNGP